MYDEDWGQFIVIDDNNNAKELYYYVNPYSCIHTFLDEAYFTRNEILQKPRIMDNCICLNFVEEMISFCFKNLLCENH